MTGEPQAIPDGRGRTGDRGRPRTSGDGPDPDDLDAFIRENPDLTDGQLRDWLGGTLDRLTRGRE